MAEMNKFDQHMAAAAFAEAGETESARELVAAGAPPPRKRAGSAKTYGQLLLFGAVSLALYLTLFVNETLVTELFTLGGWHTVYPVLTALIFSFIHGAFASNLLSVLGLEARKK